MSSEKAFFAVVAGYVGVVLWCLAFGDSARALVDLVARLGLRPPRGRNRPGLHRRAPRWRNKPGLRRRVYVVGAFAGAGITVLAVAAVVATRGAGSGGRVAPEAALKPQPTVHLLPTLPRVVFPPVVASRSRPHPPVRMTTRTARPAAGAQRGPEMQTTRVSYVVRTVTPAGPAASTTSPALGSSGSSPGPLPAPAQTSAPRPLKAP